MAFSIIREEPAPLAQQASSFLLSRLAITLAPLEAFRQWVLEEYPQRLGIPIENTVAAGDAANDLSMLRAAGIGVAMCNGTDEAKAAADAVTCQDNNHDGMAEIIEKYLVHR
ncbi:HAD hydrolase family protein [Pseudoflavonifractor capillosus]|uniref:HAD hydrolase family protein n=1 Tax=Pseudoflavonifractor capillosus TaxID=106588 RepID=UPI0023B90BC9|nr:HAD hydrolase family protein [Pseudoflavonifractor capillosus]